MSIDHIKEVNKNIDEIEHIEKFNPFHDARGRFASARGMASYSANPNTKAGQMAIGRSTAAGYGAVMNVHRESKGENIRQNDMWIRSGQKPTASQLARAQANAPKTVAQARQNAHTNRVKGTMGATETAQARNPKAAPKQTQAANQQTQQTQNQQNAQTTAANARPSTVAARQQQWKQMQQQKQQQAAQQNQQNQQNQNQQTQANQNAVRVKQKMQSGVTMDTDFDQGTVKGALNKEFKGTANGKDLTKTFDATKMTASDRFQNVDRFTDKVCDMQGFNAPAKKVSQAELDSLAKKYGDLFQREVDRSWNLNGRSVTAQGMKDAYTSENDMKLNGTGGRNYGDGLYVASGAMRARNMPSYGTDHMGKKLQADMRESIRGYGDGYTVMKMAWNSKPKIANYTQMNNEFNKLSASERAKFGNHLNTYVAAKGYDAMRTKYTTDYMVIFNRSKIAVLDD